MKYVLTVLLACCMLSFFSTTLLAEEVTKFRVRSGQLQITHNNGYSWAASGPQEYSQVTGLPSYSRRSTRMYLRVPTFCGPAWVPTLNHQWRQRNYGENGHVIGDYYGGGFGWFRWRYSAPPTIEFPY